MIAIKYTCLGLSRKECLEVCGITRHDLYYIPKTGSPGRKPSITTRKLENGACSDVENSVVIKAIKDTLKDPLCDYGHKKMTAQLQHLGFDINRKKVYRLMKDYRLLKPQTLKPAVKKNYVRYRILTPEAPLTLIEMDIKQIWLRSEQEFAYVLTFIDVFTRVVLHWHVGYYMRQQEVEDGLYAIIVDHLDPYDMFASPLGIEIRSDNGPQFCANSIVEYMKENGFNQTFTHPYTPQENGHIESFHSILSKAFEYEEFKELKSLIKWLEIFYDHYNEKRLHGSIADLSPNIFWRLWNKKLITRIVNVDKKNRKRVTFKLQIPRYEVPSYGRQ
jgi:putative transposase